MKNRFDLTGKVALITGGGRGLGRAMARGFAENGAAVMLSARSENELRLAAEELTAELPARIEWMVTDMTKRKDVDRLAAETLRQFGRVDILVNNAGGNVPQSIEKVIDEDWDRLVELNLTSCMRLTRALVPQMQKRKWGRIIHISSVLGLGGKDRRNVYCATKSALIGMARASAIDLGPDNITVNCIAPGPFLTDLPEKVLTDVEKQEYVARTVLGRWADPEEIIGPALLLASEAGSYITGSTLLVDGGVLGNVL